MLSRLITYPWYSDFCPKWQIYELKLKRSSAVYMNTKKASCTLYSYNCNDRDIYVDKQIYYDWNSSSIRSYTSEIPFFYNLWQMALSQYLLHDEITCAWDDWNVSMECLRSFPQWLVLLYRQSHSHDRWCNSTYNSKTWP